MNIDFNYLLSLLSPVAPLLLKPCEKLADGFIHKMGGDAWDKAKRLPDKLRPHLKDDLDSKKAVESFINDPNNEVNKALLIIQLNKLLTNNETLAQEIALLVQEGLEAPTINSLKKSNQVNCNGKGNTIQNGSNNIFIGKARNINLREK